MKRVLAVLLFLATIAVAQQPSKTETAPAQAAAAVQANPDDVKSIDAIVHAVYAGISGPAGQPRDWDRWRTLFYSGARLIPTGKRPLEEKTGARVLTVDDYIKSAGTYFEKNAFFEDQISSRHEQFGSIAHVFSTYESRHAKGEPPFQRGINSIQLFNDGKRWWVITVMWDAETPQQPIPQKYLE